MRELVIGDIHGCLRAFSDLLEILQPRTEDTIILLGDYIDRGPASCEVIERILELSKLCKVVPLMGNHEQMLLGARDDYSLFLEWIKHGGKETLDSYERCGYRRGIEGIPAHHWQFFSERTVRFHETNGAIFVHATVHPNLPMQKQPDLSLFWECFSDGTVHRSGKQIICGHTSQMSGLPALFRDGVCIDTWVYGRGWLTAFDRPAGLFMQTNQRGEQRRFCLRQNVLQPC